MKTVLMRFGGYVWKNNPRSVQVTFRREVKEWKLPGKGNLLQDLGPEKRVAIGEGELFGEDCFYQFEQLAALCREGRKDFLVLPDSTGFEARLISLSMIGEAGPQAVGYRFEFWEQVAGESGTAEQSPQYHTVREGETLWEIAGAYQISASRLAELNPWIRRPDELIPGEKVALR